jgi:hypothetical protein
MRDSQRQLQALNGALAYSSFGGMTSVEKQGDTIAVKGTPRVIVEAKNCSVIIRGWDKSEVEYSLTRYSRTAGAPNSGLTVDKDDTKVKIKVNNNNPTNRLRLEIFVPRKSNLKISSDKEIRLDGVSGELDLSSANEDINVRDSDGKLTVASEGGNIRVVGFQGEVNSTTIDSTVSLEGEFTKLDADAGDGTVVLTIPGNSGAYLSTATDNIFAEGIAIVRENDRWKIGKGGDTFHIATTSEGKVVVRNSNRVRAVN